MKSQLSFVFLRNKVGASGVRAPSRVRASVPACQPPGPAMLPCVSRCHEKPCCSAPLLAGRGRRAGPAFLAAMLAFRGQKTGSLVNRHNNLLLRGRGVETLTSRWRSKGLFHPAVPWAGALVLGDVDPDCSPGVCTGAQPPSEPWRASSGVGDALAESRGSHRWDPNSEPS